MSIATDTLITEARMIVSGRSRATPRIAHIAVLVRALDQAEERNRLFERAAAALAPTVTAPETTIDTTIPTDSRSTTIGA